MCLNTKHQNFLIKYKTIRYGIYLVYYHRYRSRLSGWFGVIVNLILGIIGGVLGGWVFSLLGISAGGILGSLITSTVGAILLLWIGSLFNKSKEV